jgi:hypothetical protein
MDFPSLPTDNLYKFLALSGLALILVSFVFPGNLINDLELKSVDAQTQINLLAFESSILERDVEAAGKKDSLPPDELVKLDERRQRLKAKLIETEGQKNRLAVLVRQVRLTFNLFRIGGFAGLAMSSVGFLLWYRRVQKPADLLARKQLGEKDA